MSTVAPHRPHSRGRAEVGSEPARRAGSAARTPGYRAAGSGGNSLVAS